ncbi:MAG: NAD(+)/NADH kinase [Coriobacteriales bacterium]
MKVLIVPSALDEVGAEARYLASRLVISGIDALVHDPKTPDKLSIDVDDLALVVCMGGDGTFLRAVRLVDFAPVPMLALNYGTLAFLAGNPARDDVELVMNALAGDMVFEHRSTADITIEQADGQLIRTTALNEVAYTRGRSGRVVEYRYGINGITIAQLKADGLVVATPTGSTGYALSAGGPIVSPAYTGLVVVPVAPHALNTRAIVLAPSDVLEVVMDTSRSRDASVFVDGTMIDVDQPVAIEVRRGERDLLLARGGDDFFRNVSRVFFGGPYPDMPDRQ